MCPAFRQIIHVSLHWATGTHVWFLDNDRQVWWIQSWAGIELTKISYTYMCRRGLVDSLKLWICQKQWLLLNYRVYMYAPTCIHQKFRRLRAAWYLLLRLATPWLRSVRCLVQIREFNKRHYPSNVYYETTVDQVAKLNLYEFPRKQTNKSAWVAVYATTRDHWPELAWWHCSLYVLTLYRRLLVSDFWVVATC